MSYPLQAPLSLSPPIYSTAEKGFVNAQFGPFCAFRASHILLRKTALLMNQAAQRLDRR
tara:strand:+ start:5242 stop:5418 length:177 start_codon:yes stop_codon:yes gene_type:complete